MPQTSDATHLLQKFIHFSKLSPSKIAPFTPEKITIPNPSAFVDKINRLKYDLPNGSIAHPKNSIDFIADFDYTITKYQHENQMCDSTFGIWKKGRKFLPDEFLREYKSAYEQFGPYETDASISYEQKTFLMQQLYYSQLSLFEKYHITEEMTEKVLANANIVFRSHTPQFFQTLSRFHIPLHIISGGISDAIYNTIVATCKKDYRNISIHSNQMQSYTFSMLDENNQFKENKFVRFKLNNFVHSFNKYQIMSKIQKRRNCFLMGDLLSDIYMAQGNDYENIVSVFYGKEGQNDQRALAENSFDIIVEGDSSHKLIVELLKVIHHEPGVDWQYLKSTNSNLHELLF